MIDKDIERRRYDDRAQLTLESGNINCSIGMPAYLSQPYDFYFYLLQRQDVKSKFLEIGAGMGENTQLLLDLEFDILATDISPHSVKMMNKRFSNYESFSAQVADMEKLPFDDGSFNVVCSAGSLSYGDHDTVLNEIHRVLMPGGFFISIDSLNNNPIYRLNRYVHYLRGNRSFSVIKRAPDLNLLQKYDVKFDSVDVRFFGSISYLTPLLNAIFGEKLTAKISDGVDRFIKVKRSAFKFVMIAEKKI